LEAPIGVVHQPRIALRRGGCRVGDLHVAVGGDRAERRDDVRAQFVRRPVLQHLAAGLQQVDDRLLFVPFADRDRVADDADLDVQAAGVEDFLVALEDDVPGDARSDQIANGGEDDGVATFAREIRL